MTISAIKNAFLYDLNNPPGGDHPIENMHEMIKSPLALISRKINHLSCENYWGNVALAPVRFLVAAVALPIFAAFNIVYSLTLGLLCLCSGKCSIGFTHLGNGVLGFPLSLAFLATIDIYYYTVKPREIGPFEGRIDNVINHYTLRTWNIFALRTVIEPKAQLESVPST